MDKGVTEYSRWKNSATSDAGTKISPPRRMAPRKVILPSVSRAKLPLRSNIKERLPAYRMHRLGLETLPGR